LPNATNDTNKLDKKILHSKIEKNKLLGNIAASQVWKWITVHHFDFVTGWQEIKIDRLVGNFVLVGWFVCV